MGLAVSFPGKMMGIATSLRRSELNCMPEGTVSLPLTVRFQRSKPYESPSMPGYEELSSVA
jgi:hypothetical protein